MLVLIKEVKRVNPVLVQKMLYMFKYDFNVITIFKISESIVILVIFTLFIFNKQLNYLS